MSNIESLGSTRGAEVPVVEGGANDFVVSDTNIQREDQQGDVRDIPDRGARIVRLLLAVARGVRGAEGVQSS